jgi:TRAP transporter TAXI family solute receptor
LVIRAGGAGGTGHSTTVAIASVWEEVTGVKFAVVPTDATLAQYDPIRKGEALFCSIGPDEPWLGLEGKMMFDAPDWGPQSMRMLSFGTPTTQGWGTQADSGIKTLADVAGRRVAQVPEDQQDRLLNDAIWAYTQAHPDYPALTWDDVKPGPISGFDEGQDALLSGAVDVAVMNAHSSTAYELASSIRGLHWIPLPANTAADKAAWEAFQQVQPYYFPITHTGVIAGSNVSPANPAYCWGYARHLVAYDCYPDDDLAYWVTMLFDITYPQWKDVHTQLNEWHIDTVFAGMEGWFVPWHNGSINYFKDIGRWTPEAQAKQEKMLARYPQTMTCG